VEVVWADALQFDFGVPFRRWKRKIKVVANLPYEISTPMIFRLLKERESFSLLVLMLQLEVARRLAAQPGTRDAGLSIWSQLYSDVKIAFQVKPIPSPPRPSTICRGEIQDSPCQGLRWKTKEPEKVVRGFHVPPETLGKASSWEVIPALRSGRCPLRHFPNPG
jgi:16S rRNA (adenine1518-N6/adenine1519-N6)-dimethyltransferase